jgi:hypothetical protein
MRTVIAACSSVSSLAQAVWGAQQAHAAGVEPDAVLRLAERVVHPLDLAAQRAPAPEPVIDVLRDRPVAHAGGHLVQQVGHGAAEIQDGLGGRLHPRRGQDEPGGQPGGGPDECLDDPPGGGRLRRGARHPPFGYIAGRRPRRREN